MKPVHVSLVIVLLYKGDTKKKKITIISVSSPNFQAHEDSLLMTDEE